MHDSTQWPFEPALKNELAALPTVAVDKGALILKENAWIKEIPLLLRGRIKVRKTDEEGKEIILYHIAPGQSCILSITSCLNDKQSKAEAISENAAELIVVPARKVKQWMDNYKSWRKFVLKLYYDRLDELLQLVDAISFRQTDERLYDKLKELQQAYGNEIPITHQSLAHEIGTAREVISRLLKELEKENRVALERGIIKIIGPL